MNGNDEPVQILAQRTVNSLDELTDSFDQTEYANIVIEGKNLRIGSLSAGDMIEWAETNDGEAKRTAGLRLISKSLCSDAPANTRYAIDPTNIAKFRKWKHRVTEQIIKEILKLNGMEVTKSGQTKAEEEAKKG